MSDTGLQKGIQLERAIERLAQAVARVEEASRSARAASLATTAEASEATDQELALLNIENESLRENHEAILRQLDGTIERLRQVLGD